MATITGYEITMYSAWGGSIVRASDNMPICVSFRVQGDGEITPEALRQAQDVLEDYLDGLAESGEYYKNPDMAPKNKPRQQQAVQAPTLPDNPEQDEIRQLEEAINIANTGASVRTWGFLELFIPSITKDKVIGLRALSEACDACRIIPDMSDDDIISRLEVYISILKEVAVSWQGTIEERNAEVEKRTRAFFAGDLDSMPRHNDDDEPEPSDTNGLPEFVEDRGVQYRVKDQDLKTRVFNGMVMYKATNKDDKPYMFWKLTFSKDLSKPTSGKMEQGFIPTFTENADKIRAVVPEKFRPEKAGQWVEIPHIRATYFVIGSGDQKNSIWVKFEAAQ
jgi:hypothetical protein